jgi:hypothetical protein
MEGGLHGSVRCEQLGDPHRAKEEFNRTGAVVSYLYQRGDCRTPRPMKLTTIALAIAFALPTTVAFAEGTLNYSTFAARPIVRGVTLTRPVATMPRDNFGNTLAPIMHDPSGSTLTPWAMSRGGR